MIKIHEIKEKSAKLKEFERVEWRFADIEHYGEEIFNLKTFIFVAKENNIVGFIKFEIAAGVCHIQSLLIAHDKRRLGIGKNLIEKAEIYAKKYKSHKIFLSTGKEWESTKFYESLGYKIGAIFPNHYGNQDFVQYVKFLS